MPTDNLTSANLDFARRYPGESGRRQPIHTFYGGAHLFRSDTCRKLGTLAERALTEHAPDPATLAQTLGIPSDLAETVYARVIEKLRNEPIENFHIDFEDGYGIRPNDEEDAAARAAAEQVALGMTLGTLPPFLGIRIKPLSEEWKARAFRTLNLFLDGLRTPPNFVVTLPKITVPEQVTALADALEPFPGVGIELMIETPQSVLLLPKLVEAARGRCTAVHFGAYDYTASLGITAARQHLLHPGLRFRAFHDAGPARRHGSVAGGRRDQRSAVAFRFCPSCMETALRRGAARLRQWLLPRLGPPSRPVAGALRGRVRILPGRT